MAVSSSSLFLATVAMALLWSGAESAEKSLFDSLPLNGALPVETPIVKPSEKPSARVLQAKHNVTSSSLFDLLPHQGAMEMRTKKKTKNATDYSDTLQRSSRDSAPVGLQPPPPRLDYGDFEVEHKPSTEVDLSFFTSNLLPPIVKSVTRNESPQYGAPIAATVPVLSAGYGGGAQPVRREKYATRILGNADTSAAGGSTVIVYANGGSPTSSSQAPKQRYGESQKSERPDKEIHYHYHINRNPEKEAQGGYVESSSAGYKSSPAGYNSAPSGYKSSPQNEYLPPQDPPVGYSRQNMRQPGDLAPTTDFPILSGPNHAGGNEEFRQRTLSVYGPPPSPPKITYSPPAAPPASSYGPPPQSSPPFLPNDQPQQPPQSLTQTSITLETIPITTTHTRLVTVPKITQTLGSSEPIPTSNQFDEAPSGGYGSPGGSSSQRSKSSRQDPRLTLNEQLLQLRPQEQGIADVSDLDLFTSAFAPEPFQRNPLVDLRTSLSSFRNQESLNPQIINGYNSLRGGTTVLTGDAVGAVSDLVREQRLQQAVSDLRSRLRVQNRDADRTRQLYRNLFYKGALLLGGLSLFPAVASVANSGGGAVASSLLPLAGRRKRSTEDVLRIREDCIVLPQIKIPMLNSQEAVGGHIAMKRRKCRREVKKQKAKSLFRELPFEGAMVPKGVRPEQVLPFDYVVKNSRCFQKYICKLLIKAKDVRALEEALTVKHGRNRWLEEAMTGAQHQNCNAFYCHS